MFVRTAALCAAASLSLIVGAQAAGWSGYYIGLNAGQGRAETDTERSITGNSYFAATNLTAVEDASMMTLDEDTFLGGAQIGVNWPLGESFVLGFEVDADGFGNDTSKAATVVYPLSGPSTFTVTNSLEQTWVATARLRLGVTTDWFMAFVTGGYAGSDMKFTQTFADTFTPFATQTIENAEFRSGFSYGGGFEVMIESGASIKVEYLYLDLGEITAVGPIADGGIALGTTTSNGKAEVTDQLIRVGINFQMD
jgi:outer membrane immunogenic protein